MRRMAQFEVSGELIREALAMPSDAVIYNIVRHDFRPDCFVFYVEHPDFPETLEGAHPVAIMPVIKADYEKRPSLWLEFDFNLPEAAQLYVEQTSLSAEENGREKPE